MLATNELKPDLFKLMRHSQSATWPLKAGYPGLAIKNLNEYVTLFSHCLVNIQNYQGIEILGIKSPVYITRFDVANLPSLAILQNPSHWNETYAIKSRRFLFGKIPPKSEQTFNTYYDMFDQDGKYTDKSVNARWTCTAQFDLFFPEPEDAPHIIFHSQSIFWKEKNLFDTITEGILGTAWSKINKIVVKKIE